MKTFLLIISMSLFIRCTMMKQANMKEYNIFDKSICDVINKHRPKKLELDQRVYIQEMIHIKRIADTLLKIHCSIDDTLKSKILLLKDTNKISETQSIKINVHDGFKDRVFLNISAENITYKTISTNVKSSVDINNYTEQIVNSFKKSKTHWQSLTSSRYNKMTVVSYSEQKITTLGRKVVIIIVACVPFND